MPDPAMFPAIRAALQANELGSGNPYKLSFALIGASGASFGIFQADTASNPAARSTLRAILNAAAMDPARINTILSLLAQPCPLDPLNAADEDDVNAAIASPQGQALVDAMDNRTLAGIYADLDLATQTASNANNSINGDAQLAICLWCNMSGPPTLLLNWLGGNPITEPGGTVNAPGVPVAFTDMQAYLQRSSFFTNHPRNWAHFSASVAQGAELLPAPQAIV